MKLKLLMGILLSAGIVSSCYATDEEFFRDKRTALTFSDPYEDSGEIMVTVLGKQGNTEEYMDKKMVKNLTGWLHHDVLLPPSSTPIYSVQVRLGLEKYDNFKDYYSAVRTPHTLKSETTAEDQVVIGEWGNMYKVYTYVRPDTTTHEKKIVVGQYKIDQSEELVEARRKIWDGTSFEHFARKGLNSHMQTRYYNFKADVYNLILKRYERASENETGKFVSETKTEVLKNKCERGDEPSKPPYQASWTN